MRMNEGVIKRWLALVARLVRAPDRTRAIGIGTDVAVLRGLQGASRLLVKFFQRRLFAGLNLLLGKGVELAMEAAPAIACFFPFHPYAEW